MWLRGTAPTTRLTLELDRAADRIAAATVVARAIVEGRRMSLADKMARLAERSQAVPAAIEARVDKLLPRLDALEASGNTHVGGLEAVVTDAEKGVAAAEQAMRKLTNGGPPLSDAGSSRDDTRGLA